MAAINNPYYTGSALGEAVDGLLKGWMTSEDRFLAKKKQEQELARQQELLNIAKAEESRKAAAEQRQIDMGNAVRGLLKPKETLLYDPATQSLTADAEKTIAGLMGAAPAETVMSDAPNRAYFNQYGGPSPVDLSVPVPNPAAKDYWNQYNKLGETMMEKGTLTTPSVPTREQWFSTVAPFLDGKEVGNTYKEMIGLPEKPFNPLQLTIQKVLENPDKYDDRTLAFVSKVTGADIGAHRKAEDKWSEPYYAEIGGKKALVQQNLKDKQIRPVIQDAPHVTVNNPYRDFKSQMELRKEFNNLQIVKDYTEISGQAERAKKALSESLNGSSNMPVDQAIITTFNKMLDPASVVRESEYARTPQDLSIMSRIRGKWDKVQKGGAGLDATERQALYRMINKFTEISAERYKKEEAQYSELARLSGFDPRAIVKFGYSEDTEGRSKQGGAPSQYKAPAAGGAAPLKAQDFKITKVKNP